MSASPFFSWQHAVRASRLEPTTKLVCYTIWSHMASDGTGCFPSYGLIAEESGLGRSTVIAHVGKAAAAGFLIVDSRTRDNGSSTSNLYRPAMPGGVQQLDPRGPLAGRGVVQQLDPHNKPSEQTNEDLPLTPSWGMWESDSVFIDLVQRYSAINPDRADCRKAWELWQTEKLADDIDAILKALPVYASGEQWQREGGRYVPSLSKWLSERGWKNVAAGLPTPEQLRERERIGKAGVDAYARIQNAKQWDRVPDPADVEAVRRWEEMKQGKVS